MSGAISYFSFKRYFSSARFTLNNNKIYNIYEINTNYEGLKILNSHLIIDNSKNYNIKNNYNDLYKVYNNLFINDPKIEEIISNILLDLYLTNKFVQFNLLFFIIKDDKNIIINNEIKEEK
jgi:hypothetical protein